MPTEDEIDDNLPPDEAAVHTHGKGFMFLAPDTEVMTDNHLALAGCFIMLGNEDFKAFVIQTAREAAAAGETQTCSHEQVINPLTVCKGHC